MNVSVRLVRGGEEVFLRRLPPRKPDGDDGHPGHKMFAVYPEMLRQVVRDYSGIGDFRELTLSEIRFFYDGLRGELRRHSRPRK